MRKVFFCLLFLSSPSFSETYKADVLCTQNDYGQALQGLTKEVNADMNSKWELQGGMTMSAISMGATQYPYVCLAQALKHK